MFAFFVRRLVQAALVMFIISVIGFSIQDNLGDPLREMVGQSVSEAERQALRDRMGLNDPFFVQYWRFPVLCFWHQFDGSRILLRTVISLIFYPEHLPDTLNLARFCFVYLNWPSCSV